MENKFENNINTGRLFEEKKVAVIKKGTIKVPLHDNVQDAISIIKSLLNDSVREEDITLAKDFVETHEVSVDDGEDRYFSILAFQYPDESMKFELAMSVGRLYINDDKKDPESSPDLQGPITIDKVGYKFGGWKKETTTGKPFTRASIKKAEPVAKSPQPVERTTSEPMINTISDEDIPF